MSSLTHPVRSRLLNLGLFVLLTLMLAGAQSHPDGIKYSGMYGFLREGEFVQLTVAENGKVIGFISRYGNPEGDVFVNHFFTAGKLEGNQLTFTTQTVKDISFEFRGSVERGQGQNRSDEGYYVLRGTIVQKAIDAAKKPSSTSHLVELRSFPGDPAPPPAQK